MDDVRFRQLLAATRRVVKSESTDPATMGASDRCHRVDSIRTCPFDNPVDEGRRVALDGFRTKLEEQLERRVQAREFLKRERDELETTGVVAPGHVVLDQL